jgi:hypothetical protein
LKEKREGVQWKSGWDNRVEISKSLHNPTGLSTNPTPFSFSESQSRRIYLASAYLFSPYLHPHLIPDLSHWSEYLFLPNPQYSLCTSFSDLTIPYCLSFRPDTSPTFGERHSRIIFGDLVRVVGEVSDTAMKELGQHYN